MLIAGPNLTIDRTLRIDELRPGEVLRFSAAHIAAGGKGVNVARVARSLGVPAGLVGFVPGRTGRAVAELIGDEGLRLEPVPCSGEVRSAAVILESGGRVTVLNEPGPAIDDGDWERYQAAVAAALAPHGVLVCSGSVPPGSPGDAYARLTRVARAADALSVVDATGGLLAAALAAGPDAVTPNLAEAEAALHGRADETVDVDPADARARALATAAGLVAAGARNALVTAGEAGVAVAGADGRGWLPAPRVRVRNPVGAGDAFTAGFAASRERGAPVLDAAADGAAVAAASVERAVAGEVAAERVAALRTVVAATACRL